MNLRSRCWLVPRGILGVIGCTVDAGVVEGIHEGSGAANGIGCNDEQSQANEWSSHLYNKLKIIQRMKSTFI